MKPSLLVASVLAGCGASQPRQTRPPPKLIDVDGPEIVAPGGWTSPNIPFYISDQFSEPSVRSLQAAADTWNQVIGRPVLVYMGLRQHTRTPGKVTADTLDQITTIYCEPNWSVTGKSRTTYAAAGWRGYGGRISNGDIVFNCENYRWVDWDLRPEGLEPGEFNQDDKRMVDLESIALHEFGHLLGLGHGLENKEDPSIMRSIFWPFPYVKSRQPYDRDKYNVRLIWGKDTR